MISDSVFPAQQVDGSDAHELHDWFGGDSLHPELKLENSTAENAATGPALEPHLDRLTGLDAGRSIVVTQRHF